MAGTRRSTRVANSSSAPIYNEDILEGKIPRSGSVKKRRPQDGSSPAAKRGKKTVEEKQQTLEQSLDQSIPAPSKTEDTQDAELVEAIEKSKTEVSGPNGDSEVLDSEMVDTPPVLETEVLAETKPAEEAQAENDERPAEPDKSNELTEPPVEVDGGKDLPSVDNGAPEKSEESNEASKAEANGVAHSETKEESTIKATNGGTAVEDHAPDHDTPSSILEKGILYFLFRGRVGIEDPHEVNDIARSFMVMRPLPHDAKLGEGPIGDTSNCRLIALPKKVLPMSDKDRFLSFVEKANASFSDLKVVFKASEYETKTLGMRHVPALTPVGEGVYAITTTGRESHLAYILTIPEELSEVQKDIGLKERGSFILSTKNPQAPSPPSASIGKAPGFPQEVLDEFRSLRWMPTQPKHLDYSNANILLIGESSGLDKATELQSEDEKKETDTPLEEMEKLEGEDEIRVKHLKGNDSIFSDLDMSKKDLPKLMSTCGTEAKTWKHWSHASIFGATGAVLFWYLFL